MSSIIPDVYSLVKMGSNQTLKSQRSVQKPFSQSRHDEPLKRSGNCICVIYYLYGKMF